MFVDVLFSVTKGTLHRCLGTTHGTINEVEEAFAVHWLLAALGHVERVRSYIVEANAPLRVKIRGIRHLEPLNVPLRDLLLAAFIAHRGAAQRLSLQLRDVRWIINPYFLVTGFV